MVYEILAKFLLADITACRNTLIDLPMRSPMPYAIAPVPKILLFAFAVLGVSCKKPTSISEAGYDLNALPPANPSGPTPPEPLELKKELVFNFAEYAANHPSLASTLGSLASKDRSYLNIGEPNRFGIQTNAKMENSLNKGFEKRTSLDGSFWVDAFAFGNKLGGAGVGSLVDMGIQANERDMSLKGYLRFLGNERLAGALKSSINQILTRSLGGDAILYGSPVLGLKVGGNIGGQIGLKADLDRNIDDSTIFAFTPKSGLNGGLTTKIESLSFARVEIAGLVNIIDSSLVNQGTFASLRQLELVVGDIGMDSGTFSALDGSIVIGASAGSEGVLPNNVDKNLWVTMTEKAANLLKKWGTWIPDLKWTHIVWDPTPIMIKDLPEFSKPFFNYFKKPANRLQCEARYSELKIHVDKISQNINRLSEILDEQYAQTNDDSLKKRLRVLANVKTNYQVILGHAQEYCISLPL